ncbi:MAG: adaptor protein MecA [Lachnospiraceae bacterium]|nr:adaptor protein MecA [Lachnospiraceae bacterium]
MRIEKISDDQIKCILTKEDLDARKLNFSELTFGSAQANGLLRDMMQQASCEFGFEADDKPLMIEVVPMQSGIIVLVITKVSGRNSSDNIHSDSFLSEDDELEEDDELRENTIEISGRVKKGDEGDPFTLSIASNGNISDSITPVMSSIHDLFREMFSGSGRASGNNTASQTKNGTIPISSGASENNKNYRFFRFATLNDVMQASAAVADRPCGRNTLYCSPDKDMYCLVLQPESLSAKDYQRICSVISDFCSGSFISGMCEAYIDEHFTMMIKDHALESLAKISV